MSNLHWRMSAVSRIQGPFLISRVMLYFLHSKRERDAIKRRLLEQEDGKKCQVQLQRTDCT